MNINIKKLHPDAKEPIYATDGSGCFDLFCTNYGVISRNHDVIFGTGLAFEIPNGFVMLIFSRSGDGFKHGIRLANCTGVIDSDYRGEVKVKLHTDNEHKIITKGERVAQALILPIETVSFDVVEELSDTVRGEGAFGSTGNL